MVSEAIKKKIGDTKLVIKIAFFDEPALLELVKGVGSIVDGFAAINTIPAPVVKPDGTQALPGDHSVKSSMCCRGVQWAGLDMARRLRALREEFGMHFAIVSSGGVTRAAAQDFKLYREAGPDLVTAATGAMWNGYLAQQIQDAYPDG
eukprot:475409-Rhodomonas_salina.1